MMMLRDCLHYIYCYSQCGGTGVGVQRTVSITDPLTVEHHVNKPFGRPLSLDNTGRESIPAQHI